MPVPVVEEGRIPFHGFHTWYRSVDGGSDGALPVLTLHGGPGACHDYLEPFEALAETGRRVIFYDQLGCGSSGIADHPHDPSMWTVELFVQEVDAVREALGLEGVHILGQSWGGMLAMEYALTQPEGLASLIIESSPASMTQWVTEATKLRDALPADVQQTLLAHEEAGTTDSPEYEAAVAVFYDRHVCRTKPMPECVSRTFDRLAANPEVYHSMNGPSEFHVIGTLKDWNIVERLGEIDVPTLLMSGRHDEATPEIMDVVQHGIAGAERVTFEESSHMCHVEETEPCLRVVTDFLDRVEARGADAAFGL
ncbi:MAG TPA: proline iminopeptidase-family hydrolase [Actinomycetota bacterium]|jgi:proline-specific peptidase|nr:proline iminopeptidase-family hydrolase [Actinomycetota bacterium]